MIGVDIVCLSVCQLACYTPPERLVIILLFPAGSSEIGAVAAIVVVPQAFLRELFLSCSSGIRRRLWGLGALLRFRNLRDLGIIIWFFAFCTSHVIGRHSRHISRLMRDLMSHVIRGDERLGALLWKPAWDMPSPTGWPGTSLPGS